MRLFQFILFAFSLTLCAGIRTPLRGDALAFYFVNPSAASFKLGLRVSAKNSAAVIRFYDAEENLVFWKYQPLDGPVYTEYKFPKGSRPGIYQIRVSGINIRTAPCSMPERACAFMIMRGHLRSLEKDQFANLYFAVPAGKHELLLDTHACKAVFRNPNGTAVRSSKKMKLNLPESQVWNLSLTMDPGRGYFGTNGFPVIYAADPKTAEAVGLSLNEFNGKKFPHKFQCRLAEWMSSIKPEDLSLKISMDLSKVPSAAAPFFHIKQVLAKQNINPASPDFGKCENPVVLAIAYSVNQPWNPYYLNPVLQKRIMIAAFYDLLRLRENDTWHTDGWNTYGASTPDRAFTAARIFALTAPHLNDHSLRNDWANGVRRIADRYIYARESSSSNSSRWALIFYYLYRGTGEKGYASLASDFIRGLCLKENNLEMRTGYFRELGGPDAGCQGRALADLALYWNLTHDKNALSGANRIYHFMNLTAAPDPDGSIHGATNFNHRTAYAWNGGRSEGAATLFCGTLYPAACWPPLKNQKTTVQNSTAVSSPWFHSFLFPAKPLSGALFPAQEKQPCFINLNGEFYAVRRNGWYLLIYTGSTARNWELDHHKPPKLPENKKMPQKWMPTQGISLMWDRKDGTWICAKNWNGNTGHFIRADLQGKNCAYPDYKTLKAKWTDQKLILTGKLTGLSNFSFTRTFVFLKNGIAQRIRLECSRSPRIRELYEQIPLLKKKNRKLEFKINGSWSRTPGITDSIRYGNMFILCDKPRRITLGPETAFCGETILPLRIHLDPSQELNGTLTYQIGQIPE